jgi:long-chain acyl-CoA synthetase
MARQIIDQLARMAREHAEAVAIHTVAPACSAQRRVTYRELYAHVNAVAHVLRSCAAKPDVVMLCAANQPEFIATFLGALSADLTIFPVHPNLTRRELSEAARRSGARTLIGAPGNLKELGDLRIRLLDILQIGLPEGANAPRHPTPARGSLMLQSSGTTGTPKIVYRSADSLDAVARNVVESTQLARNDHVLAAMPLCHSYGVENGLLAPILAGAAIHLADGFDPASIARHFAMEGITVFPGVPFMFQILAERGDGFAMRTLRLAYSAGGSLPVHVADAFHARFGIRIGQLYGSTEMGSVTFGDSAQACFCQSSVGQAMRGVTIRILDPDHPNIESPLERGLEGLVAIRGPSMLDRYVDDDSPALTDGYFFTGDLGRLDANGNLLITGRTKLQIDVGGMKVNPLEVEHVLAQHPAVLECVVVPERVTHTVNRLKAFIALRKQPDGGEAEELREFARAQLAPFKVPRLFEFRDSLPKSPTGKILREALRCG